MDSHVELWGLCMRKDYHHLGTWTRRRSRGWEESRNQDDREEENRHQGGR